jgi:hypothetical protein
MAGFRLRRFENGERTGGTTEVTQATAAGGDMLVVAGAELVVASTEALGRADALEAAHTSYAPFYAPVILFESVAFVDAGPMRNPATERCADRPRIGAMTVRGRGSRQ